MFKLVENYGGLDRVRYYKSFEAAISKLPSALWRNDLHQIDKDHLPERIDGMKSAIIDSGENFFSIQGIPYPADEQDEMSIDCCKIDIIPIEFDPANKNFFEVYSASGYYNDVICGYPHWEASEGYFNSIEECQEGFKDDPRAKDWEIPCGMLGHTGRYLAIRHHHICD